MDRYRLPRGAAAAAAPLSAAAAGARWSRTTQPQKVAAAVGRSQCVVGLSELNARPVFGLRLYMRRELSPFVGCHCCATTSRDVLRSSVVEHARI